MTFVDCLQISTFIDFLFKNTYKEISNFSSPQPRNFWRLLILLVFFFNRISLFTRSFQSTYQLLSSTSLIALQLDGFHYSPTILVYDEENKNNVVINNISFLHQNKSTYFHSCTEQEVHFFLHFFLKKVFNSYLLVYFYNLKCVFFLFLEKISI